MENSSLIKIFKDHKDSVININKKNGMVEADEKDIKDNKRDTEDCTIDIEFVISFYTNVVNLGEANKNVGDIISAYLKEVKKKVNSADKSIGDIIFIFSKEVEKRINDVDKVARDITSNFLKKVKKTVSNIVKNIWDTIFTFPRKIKKRVNNNVLVNI